MKRVYIVITILILTLLIVAVILSVPSEIKGVHRIAAIFIGVLGGAGALAETLGMFDRFGQHSRSKAIRGDNIKTEGDYSPGKIGGNYIVSNAKSPEALSTRQSVNSGQADTIETKGSHSPGKVGDNYIVSDQNQDDE